MPNGSLSLAEYPTAMVRLKCSKWGRPGQYRKATLIGKSLPFIRAIIFLVGASISACTELRYFKPGVTDEEYALDSQECEEIARQQAFREYSRLQTQRRMYRPLPHQEDRYGYYQRPGPSLSQLESDYRRECMIAHGYELVPLEDRQ